MAFFIDLLLSLGPLVVFIVLMIVIYFRGSRTNKRLLEELEKEIRTNIKPFVKHPVEESVKKVQIKPDEYEFRCKASNKGIGVLTIHLKLVNRSFIIQWLINLLFKDKERLFLGAKFSGELGEEDPVYRLDIVPYRKKMFIRQRFENFVKYDDISTIEKDVDNKFMIKSQSRAYVTQFVENPEFVRLLETVEPYLEHMGLKRSTEETDPHLAATFEFNGLEEQPMDEMINLFFIVANQHLQNHENVKKLIAKGKRGKARGRRRGSAKRGGATRRRRRKRSK